MTQIWHVCVCLLELSLLYPAPHMDTAMLRISPSFLTKPSEQLAKNNMTCCLRSELRPPGEDITGGGRSRFAFLKEPVPLWPPWLRLIQNTDQNICCELRLHERTGRRRQVERESSYFWTFFLHISRPKAGQRAFHVIF